MIIMTLDEVADDIEELIRLAENANDEEILILVVGSDKTIWNEQYHINHQDVTFYNADNYKEREGVNHAKN